MQFGVGLKTRGLLNGQLDTLKEPRRPWGDKIDDVEQWLHSQRQEVVLLCDEPLLWPSEVAEESRSRVHSQDVFRVLVEAAPCRRVVTGFLPPDIRRHTRHHLPTERSPDTLGAGYVQSWNALSATAGELLASLGDRLLRRSVLEVDLLVACAFVAGVSAVGRWLPETATARDIASFLADALTDRTDLAAVRLAWARLSLLRVPFAGQLLEYLGEMPLAGPQGCLVTRGLLTAFGSNCSMHEVLRAEGRAHEWLTREQRAQTHQQLARYYKERFQDRASRNEPGAILDEMEAFHHAASAPDRTTLDGYRAFFVDQLHTLGRVLSREMKDRLGAVSVFERALEWDGEDDYAHHYLAFNLDILGQQPRRVEEHYVRAIELDPLNVWWRSRWITFLITRGRTPEAQAAWSAATDALGLPDRDADPWLYESLHIWVARLLVHRGQIDFAEQVLRGVPAEVLQAHPGLRAIQRRLRALVEAARTRVVFPLTIPPERWWQGPHLCALQTESGKELRRWLAGRIQEIDDGVHLVVAEPPATAGEQPRFLSLSLSIADFDRCSRDEPAAHLGAGRFVELGVYGDEEILIIRVHRPGRWEDQDLPPLFPDPLRYLRADGWVG
jgi:tetratricopeptide (TPR) repeat protein